MSKSKVVPKLVYGLTPAGHEVVSNWGGVRPGAGRPRSESLDAEELTFLAWLVNDSAYSAEYVDLTDKLLRIADRVKLKGR